MLGLLIASPALAGQSDQDKTPVPAAQQAAKSATSQPNTTKLNTTKLNDIQVKGIRKLVRTLQEVKVALKRPFDNNPKYVDDMVCRLDGGIHGYLECGTQGWFRMRRNATQLTLMSCGWTWGGAGGECDLATVPTLGHPWHSIRLLNGAQRMHLRAMIKKLPDPNSAKTIIVQMDAGQSDIRPVSTSRKQKPDNANTSGLDL